MQGPIFCVCIFVSKHSPDWFLLFYAAHKKITFVGVKWVKIKAHPVTNHFHFDFSRISKFYCRWRIGSGSWKSINICMHGNCFDLLYMRLVFKMRIWSPKIPVSMISTKNKISTIWASKHGRPINDFPSIGTDKFYPFLI